MTAETWHVIAPVIYTAAISIPGTALICYVAWACRHPFDSLPSNVAFLIDCLFIAQEIKEVMDEVADAGFAVEQMSWQHITARLAAELENVLQPLGICPLSLPYPRQLAALKSSEAAMVDALAKAISSCDNECQRSQLHSRRVLTQEELDTATNKINNAELLSAALVALNRADKDCDICGGMGFIQDDVGGKAYVCGCVSRKSSG
jgi:hypothetical protein